MRHRSFAAALLAGLFAGAPAPAQLAVSSTQPGLNAGHVPRTTTIAVTFDRPVNPATFTPANFGAFARWSGPVTGPLAFSNGDRTVTLTPARQFAAGETVMLVMSHNLRGADNTALRQGGYTLVFTAAVAPSSAQFCHYATMSDRSPSGAQTRIYGGLACDLDRDGWADLTMINEVSADLRVFMNRADGSGLFGPMLTPPTPIPFESSPNEPADFNGDGLVDIVTSSNATNQIAIARGNGNGTYGTPTLIAVGGFPRGIAIVDADGDGDLDITVAVRDLDSIALLLNDGAGNFPAPTHVPSGGDGPYGLAAADMNNDGLQDLVVGHVFSQTCGVLRGNGNGTFTPVSSRGIGGANWVVACGDLNNDRNVDVSAANAGSGNASILMGNGNGTLQPAQVTGTGGHTVATDVVDLDGDGDLDWVISSFGTGRWYLYLNNGAGVFTFSREFVAVGNPACALPADLDNDGDVDLALLDETQDLIVLVKNMSGPACYANCDCSAAAPALNVNDFICFLGRFAAGDPYANCDGSTSPPVLNVNDFVCYQGRFAAGCP